jgi:hypothetical protein
VKDNRFPWTTVGARPEPRLSADFTSRVIEKAQKVRARRRLAKLGVGATALLAVLATTIWMLPITARQEVAAQPPRPPSSAASTDTSSDDNDLLAVMMPDARQAERFDTYYGPAGWNTYASWDTVSTDSYR